MSNDASHVEMRASAQQTRAVALHFFSVSHNGAKVTRIPAGVLIPTAIIEIVALCDFSRESCTLDWGEWWGLGNLPGDDYM